MGKVLTSIVLIGAAVAVSFIPGVGTAIGTAIFQGAGSLGIGVAASATLANAAIAGIVLGGLSALGGLLQTGPQAPKAETASTTVKQARPPRVSAYGITRLYGSYILYEADPNGQAIDVYAVHDGRMDGFVRLYLNDDAVTLSGGIVNEMPDERYKFNVISFHMTNGSTPGAGLPVVSFFIPSIWTPDHRGDGIVLMGLICAPVKAEDFLKVYPNGVPVPSMVARWQRCPDLYDSDPTDESRWTWTENVTRQLAHYLLVRENVDYATKIAPALDMWREAQSVCDEAIPLKAGGTEPRYRSCISHQHTARHAEVKSTFLNTMDGWMATRSDGAIAIYAGKYYTPTVSIGPEHIISYDWNGVGVDDDEATNEIVCSYISSAHDYNSVECDAWRDEDDIAQRGQILSSSLEIQTPSWGQVRRLAKRQMGRNNALYRGSVTTNTSGRIARGQRYINLHLEESGTVFYSGPVEITAVTRNINTGGITFSWVSVSPNIDAWNAATEEGDPAVKGDRIAPQPLTTPTVDSAVAEIGDDGSSARIRILVDGFDRLDITWYARWRVTTDTTWNEQQYSDIDPGPSAELLTTLVPLNVGIDVAVKYSIGDGRQSDWSPTVTVSTSTADLAPAPPSGFSVTPGTGEATANWTNPTSAGFTDIRLYRNTVNNFGTATLVTTKAGAQGALDSYLDTPLTAGSYYYFIVARNATGVASSPIASGAISVL